MAWDVSWETCDKILFQLLEMLEPTKKKIVEQDERVKHHVYHFGDKATYVLIDGVWKAIVVTDSKTIYYDSPFIALGKLVEILGIQVSLSPSQFRKILGCVQLDTILGCG